MVIKNAPDVKNLPMATLAQIQRAVAAIKASISDTMTGKVNAIVSRGWGWPDLANMKSIKNSKHPWL